MLRMNVGELPPVKAGKSCRPVSPNHSTPPEKRSVRLGLKCSLSLDATASALWARLIRKWEIGKFPPQPPCSPSMIISEKISGDCPLSSFTFDI